MRKVGCAIAALCFAASAQSQQVFFGNLHSHTSFSDGSGFPEEAYDFARNAGLDFLAITEHNHRFAESKKPGTPIGEMKDGVLIAKDHTLYKGPRQDALILAANRATTDGQFVAIYGQEFSSIGKGNHANVFFVDEVINVKNGCFGDARHECDSGLIGFLDANRDFQGDVPLVQFNHPELFSDANAEYGADDFGTEES